jgi:transposase
MLNSEDPLWLTVESHPAETGCPSCGVIAIGHGRRLRRLHDIPAFGAPVELVWRQRRYRCVSSRRARWAGSARTIRWRRLRRS